MNQIRIFHAEIVRKIPLTIQALSSIMKHFMFSIENNGIDRRAALKIVAIYALFSALWIYFSDHALALLVKDTGFIVHLSILKGFLFIIVTGVLLYQLISRHIKKFRQTERALEDEATRRRILFEQSRDGIVVLDQNGKVYEANQRFSDMLGYSAEETLHLYVWDWDTQWTREELMEQISIIGSSGDHFRTRHRRKDGTCYDVEISTNGAVYAGQKLVFCICRDITERKKAEEEKEKLKSQLLQAQKMEAVGQLAGGIAHDFNNILTAIMGYGHILKIKMKEDDPLRSYPDHILTLSERAANLTSSLLAFSRKQIINPRPVNLNEIIRSVEKLLSRIIGEDLRLETALSEQDLIVMADAGQMEQVFMNCATNARDAMPEGGLLRIETETLEIDREFIREHGFGNEGKYALISITDTGTGMDRETGEKIFEPFFTTKQVGKGTGLGLAMVYGTITQHGGHINFYSEPGKGTTFRIYLPLIQANRAAEEITPGVIHSLETGTETILLAEDESEVRVLTKKLIEDYGYKVIEATDGEDAVNKFTLHKDEIELILLDVVMPNKNGREVYKEIKEIKPDIKALFTSGYPSDIVHRQGILEKGFELIMKPAAPAVLLKKIREVLDR
jgi:PAS domain S-box-containing protein